MLWQDMVPCTEHRAVADKLEALQVEQDESTKQVSALQNQFSVAEAQLQTAAAEAAEMRSTLSEMVSQSELVTAKAECESLRVQACESTRMAEELERRLSSELKATRYLCFACLKRIWQLV
jgi:uncharacterized coiled-coil DUF342 family protein